MVQAYEKWHDQAHEDDLVRVHAWPVDPPGASVKRVMAFTWPSAA